jgi:integrase
MQRRKARVVPKNVKPVRARLADGTVKTYYYHRATNKRLEHDPWSAEGLQEIAKLDQAAKALEDKIEAHVPRSFGQLWIEYRKSEFPRLRARTRKDYDLVRDWLGDAMFKVPVRTITTPQVYHLRDKAGDERGRRFGSYVVSVMRVALEWGRKRGWLDHNPAMNVEGIAKPSDARVINRRWDIDEVEAFLGEGCPPQLRLPVCLGLFASMREGDALKVTVAAYDGSIVRWRASKNQEPSQAPTSGMLKALLDQRVAQVLPALQLCLNSRGKPWTENGFRASFFKRVRSLYEDGKVRHGLTFHGLRHTIGAIARESGNSEFDVSTAIGDRSTAMAAVYGRDAVRSTAQIRVLSQTQEHFRHIVLENDLENGQKRHSKRGSK